MPKGRREWKKTEKCPESRIGLTMRPGKWVYSLRLPLGQSSILHNEHLLSTLFGDLEGWMHASQLQGVAGPWRFWKYRLIHRTFSDEQDQALTSHLPSKHGVISQLS